MKTSCVLLITKVQRPFRIDTIARFLVAHAKFHLDVLRIEFVFLSMFRSGLGSSNHQYFQYIQQWLTKTCGKISNSRSLNDSHLFSLYFQYIDFYVLFLIFMCILWRGCRDCWMLETTRSLSRVTRCDNVCHAAYAINCGLDGFNSAFFAGRLFWSNWIMCLRRRDHLAEKLC